MRVLTVGALAAAGLCGYLHVAYLVGLIRRPGLTLLALFLGVFVLAVPATFRCLRLAASGTIGQSAQWRYIAARCPPRLFQVFVATTAFAVLRVLFDVIRLKGDLGQQWADGPLGAMTAILAAVYMALAMVLLGTSTGRASGKVA